MKRRTLLRALAVTALLGAYVHSAFVLHHPQLSFDGSWWVARALVLHESGAMPPLDGARPLYMAWLNLLMRVDPDFAGYLRCLQETVPRWSARDPRWGERFGGVREGRETLAAACGPLTNVGIYAQALLGAVGVGLVGLAGWLASRRALVAYLSVLAALLLDGYVHNSLGYLPDSLVIPLFTGVNVCLAWLALGRRPAPVRRTAAAALACGLLLGLLVLSRPPYEILLAVLPPAAAVLALRDRARRRATAAAAAVVLVGAALVVTPWAVRGAADSTTYASMTLGDRLTYNDMTWRQWLAAFPYWTSVPEQVGEPGGLERSWDETARIWKAHRERGPLFLSGRILAELPKHLAVSVPLAWRGMSEFRSGPCGIGPYTAAVWLLFLFAFARGAPRNRRVLAALTFCPAVVLAVNALVSANVSRQNLGLLLPLSVASALCCAWTIDRARSRLRRGHPCFEAASSPPPATPPASSQARLGDRDRRPRHSRLR